jgi:uncharacterized integral membrane protein
LLVFFVTLNTTTVDVSLLFVKFNSPVIAVILISLLTGYILGLITYSLLFRGKKAPAPDKKKPSGQDLTGK